MRIGNDNIRIEISSNNRSLYRDYALIDGQLPEDMQERLQDMVDTLYE